MTPFVPPEPELWERYDFYFRRLVRAMTEHYNKFLEELQHDETPKL
jgi:hypothetical protein